MSSSERSQVRGLSWGTTVDRGLKKTKNVAAATRNRARACPQERLCSPFEEWTKRRAGAPLGPGVAERLDIPPMILQRHRLVEVRCTVADAAKRMEGVGVAGMQDAQAMAKVNGVGEIWDDALAAPASGVYESLVDGAFKEGFRYGRRS